MSIALIITVRSVPGGRAELRRAFDGVIPDTLAFDGCESVEVLLRRDDEDSLVLYEHWESLPQYERYKAWRLESGTSVLATNLVAGPAETIICDPVD